MVGPEALIELAKTMFKVAVVGTVGFLVIWPELPTLMRMDQMDTGEMATYTGGLVSRLVFSIILDPRAARRRPTSCSPGSGTPSR